MTHRGVEPGDWAHGAAAGEVDEWVRSFARLLQPAIVESLRALTSSATSEVIGVGVYTDDMGSSLVAGANERRFYENLIAEDPGYDAYYRFYIGDWALFSSDLAPDPLEEANARLAAEWTAARNQNAETGRLSRAVWDATMTAMLALKAQGFFTRWPQAVVVFQPIDASISDEEVSDWVRSLNSATHAAEYSAWAANPLS